ncbi:MAG: UbiH/UbiF/VisC/COQ6 family ubiquinone biosynthesis hydroxylase [Gammaproteobacteria bacterium]
MSKQTFDIIIIGAGIVGLTMANLAAENGFDVAVVEASPAPQTSLGKGSYVDSKETKLPLPQRLSGGESWGEREQKSPYSLRVSAITPSSEKIFQLIGIWDELINTRVSPFQKMHVWDELGSGSIDFDAATRYETSLGHIIENDIMLAALLKKAHSLANITFFYDFTPKNIVISNQIATLKHEDFDLNAKLIIGADGAKSWLRNQLHIPIETYQYHQNALVAVIQTEKPHQKTAWQRFLSDGILAFLPLENPYFSSIVWSTTPALAEKLLQLEPSEFNAYLSKRFENTLGKTKLESKRQTFPLRMLHAKDYVGTRVALIGDAAHTIHPLAGQGLNLGLADAFELAKLINHAHQAKQDIGHLSVLKKYQTKRKLQNQIMISSMAGFKDLFLKKSSPIVLARNLGLSLSNRIPFIKNFFIQQSRG